MTRFRALAGVTALLFVVLAILSKVALEPGGLLIFDSRVTGYGPEDARGYLAALAEVPGARELYLGTFRALDTVFPLLLAVTLAAVIRGNMTGRILRILLLLAPLAYLAMDLLENARVAEMLRHAGPLGDTLVMQASGFTVAKWVTLGLAAIIAAGVWRADPGGRRA